MTLPDVGTLGSLAGWFLAVFVMAAVVTLIVTGKLVPGPTHDRVLKQNDELLERVGKLTPIVERISEGVKDVGKDMEFLVDFVRDTIKRQLGA
jgi:hypothetical protein